ncbi:MAG: stage II sporulation protein M [Oscillospiraceae bacterium]|jgi:uncharacterized membrane protein SpoIIM required for sporulation|nr:stage II sporulation protein M [Oscillospiraceae bacterium]
MTQEQFIRENTPAWQALERLTKGRGHPSDFHTLDRLHRLYRVAAGHLSYARSHFPDAPVCHDLNTLVTAAHHRLYVRQSGGLHAFTRMLTQNLPLSVRREWPYLLTAVGVFIAFGLYAYLFTWFDPGAARAFLPAEYLSATGEGAGAWDGVLMSSLIMVNNLQVAVLAFGLGLTLGLGTLYVVAQNAMLLGALAAHVAAQGNGLTFWSLILPHGVWELFAICLSAAAGLRLGFALLRPGSRSRKDALTAAGKAALPMMGLVAVLLVLAGLVEGFFTPADLAPEAKLLFAAVTFVLLLAYLSLCGRKNAADHRLPTL